MEKSTYTVTSPFLFTGLILAFFAVVFGLILFGASRDVAATICGGFAVYLLGQVKINEKGLFS